MYQESTEEVNPPVYPRLRFTGRPAPCGVFESAMTVAVSDLVDLTVEPTGEGGSPVLQGLLGIPEGVGPWPAVVVVHEAFGIEGEMRKQVAHLASLGYLALMPNLFSDGGMRRCLVATMRAMRSGEGRAFVDIEAARHWLLARPDATGAVGVIGFCMGGGFALMTAARGFGAAASNYGMLPVDMEASLVGACPVVGSYGGKDGSLKGAAEKLDTALTAAGVKHDVKEYPEAGHTFMNEQLTGPGWMRPLVRVMNFGPNPEAASDAWERIDTFFGEHLVPPTD